MSRNGSGVYSLVAGNPVVTGTAISSTWANNTLTDIASALTGSLAADGQTALTGNLNYGTNRAINLGNPVSAQDAVTLDYLTASSFTIDGTKTFSNPIVADITGNAATATTAITQSVGDNSTKIATTAFVQANNTTLTTIYPIGSIYISTVSTNPNTLFGFGTWVAFGVGRVLIGNGDGFTAGSTGGSADSVVVSHTHTTTVTDSGHIHNIVAAYNLDGTDSGFNYTTGNATVTTHPSNSATTGISVANSTTGVSGTNANLQPYVVVYMWNRTA